MSNIAIKAENLGKAYQLGQIGTGTISRDLERWYARMRGKEDPFLRIGETNDRSTKGESDIVWSLRDLNFEIEQGDAVGIIGRNGAGKSTLLKILSKVTAPTTGKISGHGRIASLLEVGTGFHPELSGRENIFLNGAILGMRKKEILRKFDEIVDFAGIERYIDTPVKRYSSGMYVRLAFAVAAHLESEILIVDEVLAVGDAEFQKKCLGKMGEVSKGEGRTVLFVSHNMGSIQELCNTTIVLNNGTIDRIGNTSEGIQHYLKKSLIKNKIEYEDDEIIFKVINFLNENRDITYNFSNGENIIVQSVFELKKNRPSFGFCFALYDSIGNIYTAINTYHVNESIENLSLGTYKLEFEIPKYILNTGEYTLNLHFNDKYGNLFKIIEDCQSFIIYDDGFRKGQFFIGNFPGPLSLVPEIKFISTI